MSPPGVVFLVGFISFGVGVIVGSTLTTLYVLRKLAEVEKELTKERRDHIRTMTDHRDFIGKAVQFMHESRVKRSQENDYLKGIG